MSAFTDDDVEVAARVVGGNALIARRVLAAVAPGLVARATEPLQAERIEFASRLGFGDDKSEPAATLTQMIDPIEQAFHDAGEFHQMPRLCEGCGEWLAETECERCHGGGCLPNPEMAYLECGDCAGVGRVHVGCVQQSYSDLVAQRDEARARLAAVEAERDSLRDAVAVVKRDHTMPPNKDSRGYDYRMGWWDAVTFATSLIDHRHRAALSSADPATEATS